MTLSPITLIMKFNVQQTNGIISKKNELKYSKLLNRYHISKDNVSTAFELENEMDTKSLLMGFILANFLKLDIRLKMYFPLILVINLYRILFKMSE